jgi:tetratricopeptide (TPR) repeat protein
MTTYPHALQLFQQQQWTQTIAACEAGLQHEPLNGGLLELLSCAHGALGQRELAQVYIDHALRWHPDVASFRFNAAVCHSELGRKHEAAMQYQVCLRLDPQHSDALWNYGEMLRQDEHFQQAAVYFETITAQGKTYPGLAHRLAVCYSNMGKHEAALALFEDSINDSAMPPPQRALTYWERSLYHLNRAEFEQGWVDYERRFDSGGLNKVFCHRFDIPQWDGGFHAGHTLLIHGEQGLGDEMMFASLLPQLLQRAAQASMAVVIGCKPGLVRLFAQAFPSATVRSHEVGSVPIDVGGMGGENGVQWQCALGSVAYFSQLQGDPPVNERTPLAYFVADATRSQWYAQRLAQLRPDVHNTLKIGLMWGSNPNLFDNKHATWAQQRSMPLNLLADLAHALPARSGNTTDAVSFISLQNGERGAEAAVAPQLRMLDLSTEQTDFFETAALIDNVDVVISVDTSVAHLAGGMGKRVWQPLMRRADWRHTQTTARSYWYPQVDYLRQTQAGNWYPVVEQLKQRVAQAVLARTAGGSV